MSTLPSETVRRIEDVAAALIAAGIPYPTNEHVRQHLSDGFLSHISPVMREFRARQLVLASEQMPVLPPELAQLLTGQLSLLWQAAVRQAESDTLAAREQADTDIAQADRERDEALMKVASLESELAVLQRIVVSAITYSEMHCGATGPKASLRLASTPIGPNDTAIAGHAIAAGAIRVTNNTREFERVLDLTLEDWVK